MSHRAVYIGNFTHRRNGWVRNRTKIHRFYTINNNKEVEIGRSQ